MTTHDPTNAERNVLAAERDVQARLGDRPFDFLSLDAISNIYRAAAAVRRRAESDVLAHYKLSFGGFTILWVLWVWGQMETARLADECGVAKGTLTGMLSTLEKRDLVERTQVEHDRRRVNVDLTPSGTDLIDELFPKFNQFEAQVSRRLSPDQKHELAHLLRVITSDATADAEHE